MLAVLMIFIDDSDVDGDDDNDVACDDDVGGDDVYGDDGNSGPLPVPGPERGRGGNDVPHHHSDPGGSGEVQGPEDHHSHRQWLRQHRHQGRRRAGYDIIFPPHGSKGTQACCPENGLRFTVRKDHSACRLNKRVKLDFAQKGQ